MEFVDSANDSGIRRVKMYFLIGVLRKTYPILRKWQD